MYEKIKSKNNKVKHYKIKQICDKNSVTKAKLVVVLIILSSTYNILYTFMYAYAIYQQMQHKDTQQVIDFLSLILQNFETISC